MKCLINIPSFWKITAGRNTKPHISLTLKYNSMIWTVTRYSLLHVLKSSNVFIWNAIPRKLRSSILYIIRTKLLNFVYIWLHRRRQWKLFYIRINAKYVVAHVPLKVLKSILEITYEQWSNFKWFQLSFIITTSVCC